MSNNACLLLDMLPSKHLGCRLRILEIGPHERVTGKQRYVAINSCYEEFIATYTRTNSDEVQVRRLTLYRKRNLGMIRSFSTFVVCLPHGRQIVR